MLDEDVDEVTAPGALGEFGVLPNHIAFLSLLEPGEMSYKQGATRRYLAISGGYAEVLNDVMTVLTPTAEFGLEIDVNRARTARDIAEKRLNETNFEDKNFPVAQAAVRRASARLQVAAKEGRR
jgi:F-type H+-transporting ATPase subunit epsilon